MCNIDAAHHMHAAPPGLEPPNRMIYNHAAPTALFHAAIAQITDVKAFTRLEADRPNSQNWLSSKFAWPRPVR
jgi:hypothetical protein